MRFGPCKTADDRYAFRVWAPRVQRMDLLLHGPPERILPMVPGPGGFHEVEAAGLGDGDLYSFVLDQDTVRPDPASRRQPEDVHGPSAVVDPGAFQWTDQGFAPPAPDELVLYELHVGTFTPEGTFDAAIQRLDHLVRLGVTAVELMPLAQFPGSRNWGYDGAYLYAVQESYGGPHGLQRFVDACHQRGLAVHLDVVYNHLGPEGNYLRDFCPFFTDRHKTPWGEAVNYDGPGSDQVRAFLAENALHWLRDFHLDGLRVDAVHAMFDMRPRHVLAHLAQDVRELEFETGKRYYLAAESNLNAVRFATHPSVGGFGMDGIWSDDLHHAVHALLTRERDGYYADYGRLEHLARAIAHGFAYQGQFSPFRGRTHGEDASALPGSAHVVSIQNHDQVGNRMHGERLSTLADFEHLKLAAGVMLFAPAVPLLFMGEEFAETNPFLYFVSHLDQDLVQAVRDGRKEEFAAFQWEGEPPDPFAESTFQASRLDWSRPAEPEGQGMLALHQTLLTLRRELAPLQRLDKRRCRVEFAEASGALLVERFRHGERCVFAANLGAEPLTLDLAARLVPGDYRLKLDSAHRLFAGPGAQAPEQPDRPLTLTPGGFVIYAGKEHA
jgi:maltooligosyltrehalose trehalohydrolase